MNPGDEVICIRDDWHKDGKPHSGPKKGDTCDVVATLTIGSALYLELAGYKCSCCGGYHYRADCFEKIFPTAAIKELMESLPEKQLI
jgi:hypothetical protein